MLVKRVFSILVYSLIFANLFFLSVILSYNLILKGEMVSLPNLRGKTLEEAKHELLLKRLSVRVKDTQFSSTMEKGKIVSQDPSPETKININRTVRVILSAGSEIVIAPDLQGITVESSVQILRDAGLVRGTVSHIYTSRRPAGRIITQQPASLEEVPRGSRVNVLVSRGEREPKYLMPDLTEMKAETVIAKLRDMEFKIADVRYTYYPGQEAGIIIQQYPLPGHSIQKTSLITLEISKE